MRTIERLICTSGGLAALEEQAFHICKSPYLPLYVRHAGTGPRDLPCVVVAQVFECNGRDELESEITFEIEILKDGLWLWHPISFRQASPPLYHEGAGVIAEGHFWHDETIEAGISAIANFWDEILVARGYMEIQTLL